MLEQVEQRRSERLPSRERLVMVVVLVGVEEIVLDLKELPEPADEHDDHDQSLSTRQSFGPRFEVG
jgi:hypothetical protein